MSLISWSLWLSPAPRRVHSDRSRNNGANAQAASLTSFMTVVPSGQISCDLLAKLSGAVALRLTSCVGFQHWLEFASSYAKRLRQWPGHPINVSRDPACDFQGFLVYRAFGNTLGNETALRSFLTREGSARHHQQHSLLSSDEFRNQVGHCHSWIESQASKGNLKIRGFVGNANVAGARENRGHSDTVTFDCGNHWNGDVQQPEPAIIEAKHKIVTCFGAHLRISKLREHVPVAADGKVLAGPSHDHGPKLIQPIELADQGCEGIPHFRAHGIAKFWIIQSNDRYGAAIGETQLHFICGDRIVRPHSVL